MPYIKTSSGVNWHYELEGLGEVLIFIHGWGVDKRIWRQQTKEFSRTHKVLAIDLPGHGKSSWKKIPLKEMAKDISEIIEAHKIDDYTVIGSSIGGMVALRVYEQAPQKVNRLVFVGSMPKFAKSWDYPVGLDISEMRHLGEQMARSYPSMVNVFFRSLFTKEERNTRRFRWLQIFRQNQEVPIKEALLEYLDILQKEDLRKVLKKVTCPVQFINGMEDHICNLNTISFLRKIRPDDRFDFFPKCGHFPFLSQPHEFNEVLSKFLKQC